MGENYLSLSGEVFNIWTKDGVGNRVVDLENDELIINTFLFILSYLYWSLH
jgi:hypothetical protein